LYLRVEVAVVEHVNTTVIHISLPVAVVALVVF
jgi:hypothetical protein